MTLRSILVALAAMLGCTLGYSARAHAQTCISSQAEKELRTCPPGLTVSQPKPYAPPVVLQNAAKRPSRDEARRSRAARPFNPSERRRLKFLKRQICQTPKGGADLAKRRFERARLHFDANHWELAAAGFRGVALMKAHQQLGQYAAILYLESVNQLAANQLERRAACNAVFIDDAPKLAAVYCSSNHAQQHDTLCETLARVEQKARRGVADAHLRQAEQAATRNAARDHYARAGEAYLQLWRRSACTANKRLPCQHRDALIFNAGRAFQLAGRYEASIKAYRQLLAPKHSGEQQALAVRARFALGRSYQQIAEFAQAAHWLERAGKAAPKHKQAPQALAEAFSIHLKLHDEAAAINLQKLFQRRYGRTKPQQTNEMVLHMAQYHVQQEQWRKAKRLLEPALRHIDRGGDMGRKMHARWLLARTQQELKQTASAEALFDEVIATWHDLKHKQARRASLAPKQHGTPPAASLTALTAVANVVLHRAQKQTSAATALTLPPYRASNKAVLAKRYLNDTLTPWLERRRSILAALEQAQNNLELMRPAISATAEVETMALVARASQHFDKQLHAALPTSLRNTPALRQVRLHAKRASQQCATKAAQLQVKSALTHACVAWLETHFPNRFPALEELTPQSNRRRSTTLAQPLPDPRSAKPRSTRLRSAKPRSAKWR